LAEECCVPYERIGVLPKAARTQAGYRVYPESAVERVRVVQSAVGVGCTRVELAEVLKSRHAGGAPCHRVYEIAQQTLKGIEANIRSLRHTQKYLKAILSDWLYKHITPKVGFKAATMSSTSSVIR